MSERVWLKNPLANYTANDLDASGGVVVEGQSIVEVLARGASPSFPIDCVKDVSDCVLIPGLINTHHHLYQTLTRALPQALNKPLFPWLKSLYPVWANLESDSVFLSTRLGLTELLMSGCTTVVDHHYLYPSAITDAIDTQVAAATEVGCRVMLTRGSMSLGENEGGLPPQSTVQSDNTILTDCDRVIREYHQRDEGAKVQIALAPCSPFSVTRELMQQTSQMANEQDVLLHTHLAETLDENAFCLDKFGQRPLDYLADVGWLQSKTWLAHGIHFNDDEITRLGSAKVGVTHCPSSNMILSSGIARTKELETAGVRVGLGVDGSASNDCSNMMQEVRQALLINRLRYPANEVSHTDALRWATKGSASILHRDDIGEIAVGKQADLALFKLDELRFSGSHDPLAALVLCGAHRAHDVMVAGEWKVLNGELLGKDIEQLQADHSQAAKRLVAL